MTIGKRISELRKAKGYSQEYIAEQLGVSRQAVSKWEQDQTCPDTKNLIALAKLLETTVEYIAVGAIIQSTDELKEQSAEEQKRNFHNILVSCATFSLLIGLALTLAFPFVGPVFIVVAIVFMVMATTFE